MSFILCRGATPPANVGTISDSGISTQPLFNDGKSIHERSNKTRLKDHTCQQLLKLARRAQPGKLTTEAK